MNIDVNNQEENVINPPQKPPKFPFLFRRFAEFLIISILCSIPFALIYQFGFTKSTSWAYKIMGVSFAAYVIANAYLLRAFFYSMGNKIVYFNVNVCAYAIYAVVNIATLLYFGDNYLPSVYSYIFMPMKFVNLIVNEIFMGYKIANIKIQLLSAIVTHIFMYSVIFASPLEMYTFDMKKK